MPWVWVAEAMQLEEFPALKGTSPTPRHQAFCLGLGRMCHRRWVCICHSFAAQVVAAKADDDLQDNFAGLAFGCGCRLDCVALLLG